jgi:NAD(P)-dependent dehydrogenase (short-subunit alcohol dehydrogenase family)
VVLVTGAARRLGAAIAEACARAGWDLALHCHRSAQEAEELAVRLRGLGRRAQALAFDLAGGDDPARLLDAAAAALGPITAVVNNASVFERDELLDFTREGFERHMLANVQAPLALARALHARLGPEGRGVVVNLLDQKLWNPNPDFFTYTLSKSALEAATGLAARALAPRLRVVGVAPGLTLPARGVEDADFGRAHQATPLGRSSTPQDIAQAVAYLLDAPAVTGTTLIVDGGQHLVPTHRDVLFVSGAGAP